MKIERKGREGRKGRGREEKEKGGKIVFRVSGWNPQIHLTEEER